MKKIFQSLKESFIGRFFLILWISGKRYGADGHGARAVALTYYTLFAIVPTAALLFGIAKGFDLDERLRATLTERFAHQQQLLEYVYKFADTTLKQAKGGIVAGVGVSALIWTYKYDTGFTADDGFWAEDDLSYTYVPSPTPKGLTMKARIYQDGDRLELEGEFNENRAADGSKTPVVYKRQ